MRSVSPQRGTVVEVRLWADRFEVSHPGAVMSYGVAREGDGPLQTETLCPFINLFPSETEYELWRSSHPEAVTVAITVEDAVALARERTACARDEPPRYSI